MSLSVPSLPPSAGVVARYGAAIAARDLAAMAALRTPDCVVDQVNRDAWGQNKESLSPVEFYRSLFAAFRELDFETVRTLAADDSVFSEWVLRGSASGPLEAPFFTGLEGGAPAGRAVRLRGATLFELTGALIRRETIYFDYLTLVIELGVK